VTMFLAIDQSTSATKAMLFDQQGALVDRYALPHRQIYPRSGWVEHDAEEIYTNTLASVRSLLEKNSLQTKDLNSLSITNQRETFVIFERGSGKPLYNAIVWQCSRGEAFCQQLQAAGHGPFVQERTGLKIDTYFPASKMRWLLDEQPALRQKLEKGEALFGTIDSYLIFRLTGGRVYATDHTNASRTLLYDIETLQWNQDLFDLFGIPATVLPDIRESRANFGQTDLEGFLDQPLPIWGVMGDSQAALFAQRCYASGDAKVTFGSGSSLLLNIGSQKYISNSGSVTAIAWVLDGHPTYALEGITNFTGATINWLRDQLQLIQTPAETESLALSVPDNGGVYLVPAFAGLSAPYWRPDARAAILGLSAGSTKGHVVRAALESIGYIVNDVLQQMSNDANIEMQYIHADGGATQNRFLMQFVADLSGLKVRAARVGELSALGAVLSGMLGLGIYQTLEDLQHLPNDAIEFTPQMNFEVVEHMLMGWRNAVRQVLFKP
jgi:glycerol kinase